MPRRFVALALAVLAALSVAILPVMVGHGAGDTVAMTLPSPAAGSRTPPAAGQGHSARPDPGLGTDAPERNDGRRPAAGASQTAEHAAALDSLEPDLVLLGSWTVHYAVGPENGDGANVRIPLRHLDGLVIE